MTRVRATLGKRAADVLEVLARQTKWLDLADTAPRAVNLDHFDIEAQGMSVRLQNEFTAPDRFNLVVTPAFKLAPAERRTMEDFQALDFCHLHHRDTASGAPEGLIRRSTAGDGVGASGRFARRQFEGGSAEARCDHRKQQEVDGFHDA